MNVPKQFEYLKTLYQFCPIQKAPEFVTVLEEFEHHYTGTKMYRVRVEYDGTFGFNTNPHPVVDYKTVSEAELSVMLETRTDR